MAGMGRKLPCPQWLESGHRPWQHRSMQTLAVALVLSAASFAPAIGSPSDAVAAFVHQRLHVSSYELADADLNDDGRSEVFVYATDRDFCGSGGCALFVLSPHEEDSFRVVLHSTVTQRPIWLLPTSTRGWRDVGVGVAGGGIIHPYTARLRFDGRRYPNNPTVLPAAPLRRPKGKVLISG